MKLTLILLLIATLSITICDALLAYVMSQVDKQFGKHYQLVEILSSTRVYTGRMGDYEQISKVNATVNGAPVGLRLHYICPINRYNFNMDWCGLVEKAKEVPLLDK